MYAPIGLALTVRDRLPRQVRQRRQAVLNRVQLAKFIGQYVVRHVLAHELRQLHPVQHGLPALAELPWQSIANGQRQTDGGIHGHVQH